MHISSDPDKEGREIRVFLDEAFAALAIAGDAAAAESGGGSGGGGSSSDVLHAFIPANAAMSTAANRWAHSYQQKAWIRLETQLPTAFRTANGTVADKHGGVCVWGGGVRNGAFLGSLTVSPRCSCNTRCNLGGACTACYNPSVSCQVWLVSLLCSALRIVQMRFLPGLH